MAGAILNSNKFKGVSAKGQIAKGLTKGGIVFWKPEEFHPLTVRIFARANSIGATLPTDQQRFDSYIKSMVDIITANIDVLFRFRGTGDANFKRINLANPEGALADFYGGYTLDISGLKGNGINAYVDANFNPSLLISGQKYQLNDASRGAVIVETQTNGVIDGLKDFAANSLLAANHAANRINQSVNGGGDYSGTGLKIISRVNSNSVMGINKDVNFTNSFASASLSNGNQLILSRQTTFSTVKVSSYFIGKQIPFSVSQLIRTAENADMANLGITQIA